MGSINYLLYFEKEGDDCSTFKEVCAIQSFITSWSSLSSFFWTVSLGFYLYLTLVHTKIFLANRFIPVFHVFNWGFPILICLPLLAAQKLGYSPFAASTWCFIRTQKSGSEKLALILIGGKLWEILAYVLVIALYATIKYHIRRQVCNGYQLQGTGALIYLLFLPHRPGSVRRRTTSALALSMPSVKQTASWSSFQ